MVLLSAFRISLSAFAANTCSQFPDTTPACTSNCAKNGITESFINGANVPDTADNSEVYSNNAPQNPKFYSGFDWTSCLGLASGDSCQPTCKSSVSVVVASGSSFTLACDSNGYIGYRSTDSSAAATWDNSEGAQSPNSGHVASTHFAAFGFWVNFGDYPYTALADGGVNTGSTTANALQCYLPVCDATSTAVTNNLVANAGAGVQYTDCEDGDTTGDTCTPSCYSGYTTTYSDGAGSAKNINLLCDSGTGGFDGTTNVQCNPNVCTASAVQCSSSSCSNNRVWTSCDGLTSGATCMPTCASGFTGNAVATGFTLDCAASTGQFDGDLEPSLTSCTENKCENALASTKTVGINYEECEHTPGSATYFSTGRMCAPHCDQNLGYTSNIPPDVVATIDGSNYGTGYHVDDLISVPDTSFVAAAYLSVPDVILKVATLGGSAATNSQGVLEGPIATVTVITPAHPYRGITPGGSADSETISTGTVIGYSNNVFGFQNKAGTSSANTAYMGNSGASQNNDAIFDINIRRVIITSYGSGWSVGDTFTIADSQLGSGGAPDYVVTVGHLESGGVGGVYINDQNALNVISNGALRKPGYYTGLTPNAKSNSAATYPTVSIIVPQMKEMSCNTAAASPTTNSFATFDFDGSINSGMTCAANLCFRTSKSGSTTETIDWTDCLNKYSGQTCTPVCKGGYATTQTGTAMTLKCPNGWIDTAGWAGTSAERLCASGTCSTSAITNAITGVDYSNCNGLNTGQTCTPTCPPRVGHICHWLGDHGFLRVGRVVQRFADNPDFMLPAQVHKYCAYQRANRCRLLELRQQIHWGDLRANLLCRFRHPDGCFVFCSHVQL